MIVPRLISRYDRQVELTLPANRGIRSYELGAANTLDAAFAGTTTLFQVSALPGSMYRSKGLRKRRVGGSSASFRNLVRAVYDPEEFWPDSPTTLPHDIHQGYLRVAEVDHAGTVLPEGPILVLPAGKFFRSPRPSLSLSGTAPNEAALATLLPPSGAMHVVLPRFSDRVTIRNKDATNDLFVSFGEGQPENLVPANEENTFFEAAVSEVFLRGEGATVAFDASFAVVNGEMA